MAALFHFLNQLTEATFAVGWLALCTELLLLRAGLGAPQTIICIADAQLL
jgi:hypothetical protein